MTFRCPQRWIIAIDSPLVTDYSGSVLKYWMADENGLVGPFLTGDTGAYLPGAEHTSLIRAYDTVREAPCNSS